MPKPKQWLWLTVETQLLQLQIITDWYTAVSMVEVLKIENNEIPEHWFFKISKGNKFYHMFFFIPKIVYQKMYKTSSGSRKIVMNFSSFCLCVNKEKIQVAFIQCVVKVYWT